MTLKVLLALYTSNSEQVNTTTRRGVLIGHGGEKKQGKGKLADTWDKGFKIELIKSKPNQRGSDKTMNENITKHI